MSFGRGAILIQSTRMPSDGTEQRKLAAIMFTDMVGYSAMSQRNEGLAQELLEEHRALLRPLFPRFNGTEIKTIGDAFLVEFHSALEAAQCGIEIQRALAKRNHDVPSERRIELKIGIHIGDVVHRGGDVYGDGVNIASRIEPLAGAGGICVSMDVERQIRNALEARFEKLAPTELKNISLAMDLFRIVLPWEKEVLSVERGASQRKGSQARWLSVAGLVGGLIVVIGLLVQTRAKPTRPIAGSNANSSTKAAKPERIEWLAVLPLKNYSGDTNQEYFVDGMTDILQGELSLISGLNVKSHTTAMLYKGTTKSVPEIGRELKVDAVVEGSVQREGNDVVISVQLIEAATDRHLWFKKYSRDMSHVLKMQGEVAEAIAAEVKAKLTPEEQGRLASAPSINPAALEEYFRGRQQWYRFTREGFEQSLQANLRALNLDSNCIPAYLGVASCYTAMANNEYLPPKAGFAKGREMLNKAHALDPALHWRLNDIGPKLFFEWDWAGAKEGFARVLELQPNDGLAHQLYSFYLTSRREFDQSMIHAQRAAELEPLVPIANISVARVLYFSGRYDEAVRAFRTVVERFPRFPLGLAGLGFAYVRNGQPDEAIKVFERALESERLPRYLAGRGAALAVAGRSEEARKAAQELEVLRDQVSQSGEGYVSPVHLATVYAALGDKTGALEWLNRGIEERAPYMWFLKVDPAFENLRDEPKFKGFLATMGLD